MSTVCVSFAEKIIGTRIIILKENIFPIKNPVFFAWLGLERLNYAKIPPIGTLTPVPREMSFSDIEQYYYPVKHFLEFDYNEQFEDRSVQNTEGEWKGTIHWREKGVMRSFKEALGEDWINTLKYLQEVEAEHVRFYFT